MLKPLPTMLPMPIPLGFKKDQVVFKEYLTAYEKGFDHDLPRKEWAPEDFYRTYGAQKALVEVDGTHTNYTQGSLTPTKNMLDIAINGPGFYEVLSPNGIRFTRRGTFTLNSKRQLVTNQGFPVLKKSNLQSIASSPNIREAIQSFPKPTNRVIKIPDGTFTINREGEIFSNNKISRFY